MLHISMSIISKSIITKSIIGASLMQWVTGLAALVMAALHPVPRHATQHHHQPVKLPELAMTQSVVRLR